MKLIGNFIKSLMNRDFSFEEDEKVTRLRRLSGELKIQTIAGSEDKAKITLKQIKQLASEIVRRENNGNKKTSAI